MRCRSTPCCCARCSRRSTPPTNSGHFGLAYQAYTHFTSPIRRYPDLLVHRVIKALLAGKRYHLATGHGQDAGAAAARRASAARMPSRRRRRSSTQAWEAAGAHCSANERRADEASRDVEAWLKCRYMREHLGEEFSGTVSAATSFGLFVQLDSLYVEGLVHITELGGEYFRFDEVRQELRGERTGVRYAIGSRVRVQVSRVDLDGRKIDFRMVRDAERGCSAGARPARSQPDRGGRTGSVKEGDRAVKRPPSGSGRAVPPSRRTRRRIRCRRPRRPPARRRQGGGSKRR